MSKYIDAEIFRAKITDLCANANFHQQRAMEESNREDFISSGGEIYAYAKVLSFIDSLQQEQPEVDLEKELKNERTILLDAFGPMNGEQSLAIRNFARHFSKLGQSIQYQKDRREFSKLKAKEWKEGFNIGYAKGLNTQTKKK